MSGSGRESSRIFWSDREVLRISGSGREASPMTKCGREALLNVREWSGGPPECPGEVGRPSWMSGSSLETYPDV